MTLSDADVTLDDLQNGFFVYQWKDGFRFGADAVLLSDFVQIRKGETAVDLGTGTGILPILLSAKTEGRHFTGIEIQEEYVQLARESVARNGLQDRIRIEQMDLKDAAEQFGHDCFDVCMSNPPYMPGNHGKHSPDSAKALARHEIACSLEDVVRTASALLKTNGRFFLIHRPNRLAEIIGTLRRFRLEPKRMKLIYPYIDREPTMVLIEALKGGKSGMVVEAPHIMYVHEPGGQDGSET